MTVHSMRFFRTPFLNLTKTWLTQQARYYARDPFPSKVAHYLYRSKLIDSIRLSLRSNPSSSLNSLLNDRLLDSFVITHVIRSCPSSESALSIFKHLEKNPHFSHTQNTIHALATMLSKFQCREGLKSLINAVKSGQFYNVRVNHMNLIQWYATAQDLDSALEEWDRYRCSDKSKNICTESYNIVMHLYAQMGKSSEAVGIFQNMVDEGAVPNCRTYKIMIGHLVSSGKIVSAFEVFNLLPFLRIKRTSKQYSILIEGLMSVNQFEDVRSLLRDMKVDGVLPSREMLSSLQRMKEEGFLDETDVLLREMMPDERIKSIGYFFENDSDGEEDNERESDHVINGVQLKPWLDPRALANALNKWSPIEVSALEGANIIWTSRLVCKILRNFNSPETAWEFFCWVSYQPGFTHDIYTVQRMITHFAAHGCVELVNNLLSKVRREGITFPLSTIRLIIDFYGVSKRPNAALNVFHDYKSLVGPISKFNSMLLYSSLLRTLTKCGKNSEALNILDEMILSGIFPDIQTFSGLMHYFAMEGDIKTVQKLFSMVRQGGLDPDAFMFKVLIQAYCKSERAALALRVFEDLRNCNLLPDRSTKELLVKSLWKEGKRKEATFVEESCEEAKDVLPLRLSGHIWTVSLKDLQRVYEIYSESFTSNDAIDS